MMMIKGRHIRKAIVDRRRMNSCKLRFEDGCRLKPCSPDCNLGDHVWTVSAIIHAADLFGSASHRVLHMPSPTAGMRRLWQQPPPSSPASGGGLGEGT